MDFRVNEDQRALQEGVRAFCEGRVPASRLGALAATGQLDRALWSELAELGVFALPLAQDAGGLGLGWAEAVLVFAELGRRLVPGPLAWTALAADLVPGAASGQVVVGGLDLAGRAEDPLLVEHLDALDALLVLRRDGVYRVDPRTLAGGRIGLPLDPLTPLHHVATLPEGERLAGAERSLELRLAGAALTAAQLFGIAEATCELAVGYAKERRQFGRPIGSFQALKHLLADMFVRQEVARAAVYAAGASLDPPGDGAAARAVSAAKLTAGEAALRNAGACIQVHGGMGFAWEVSAHYYLKRVWVWESVFGSGTEHCDAIARAL